MIFVDTSIWIHFFRGTHPHYIQVLRELLDQDQVALSSIVRLELLAGARLNEIFRLRRVLSALPVFYPTEDTWKRIDTWIEPGIKSGQRFGIADLLIASTTVDQEGQLWSLDSDYKRMESLGFVKRFSGDPKSI